GTNPGDLLAAGFDRALDAISNVAGAITGLDGSRANIGIFGQGVVSSGSVGSDTVTSGSITPNSVLTPSRLFRQYGRWVDQGLIIGLNRDAGAAADASASMAQGVVDAASGMSPTLDPIGL
ncbi:hypothetical protein, partial [Corynebacterium amycolatum]